MECTGLETLHSGLPVKYRSQSLVYLLITKDDPGKFSLCTSA